MTTTITGPLTAAESARQQRLKRITVFHCANALKDASVSEQSDVVFRVVKMPCSSMTREVHLLRAFEDGADAVLLLVCPENGCRYLEGNIRAAKRVARVKKLLDEIGLDGSRLNIYHVPEQDKDFVQNIINRTLADLTVLGPNPAA